eukprot:2515033-Prymnesium_polylepis.1
MKPIGSRCSMAGARPQAAAWATLLHSTCREEPYPRYGRRRSLMASTANVLAYAGGEDAADIGSAGAAGGPVPAAVCGVNKDIAALSTR